MAADIGKRVAYYRGKRKMSAQDLADRCGELGVPEVTRTVITKLENGRRESVSVTELQVLAIALGTPSVQLLYGLGLEDSAEVLPGRRVGAWDAAEWFRSGLGESSLYALIDEPVPDDRANAVTLYEHYWDATRNWVRDSELARSLWAVAAHERAADDRSLRSQGALEQARAEQHRADFLIDDIVMTRAQLRDRGFILPPMEDDLAAAVNHRRGSVIGGVSHLR